MAKVEFSRATKLAMTVQTVLNILTDDHEACYICDKTRDQGHDKSYACGELEALIPKKLRDL